MKNIISMLILTASVSIVYANGNSGNTYGSGYTNGYSNSSPQGYQYQQGTQGQYSQGQYANQYQQDSQGNSMGGNQMGSPNDQTLTQKIQTALRSLLGKYSNVNLSVSNGVVTLQGTVATQSDKDNLEQIIRNFPGVTDVNNQVMIQGNQGYNQSSGYGANSQYSGAASSYGSH
jgi:osmotically-inducible protein OsmY